MDPGAAEVLYGLLRPYTSVNAMAAGEVSLGPVARFAGILAAACGRADAGAGHFEVAMAIDERIAARPWLAHAQEEYARVLRERDAPGDAARAHGLLAALPRDLPGARHRAISRLAGGLRCRPRPARP